ncbi:E3 ubiquitin/ISG15 ligase TRIM25-like [Discoglossus pictus]
MASADLIEELNCSICLSIYTDPVMLSCGHNFCQGCIGDVLDTQKGFGVYTCPECRAEYQERPVPQRNLKLCNIAEHFLSTQLDQVEAGICCTYCVHSFVPASKTCLMCEASLCDTHLRVHSKSEDHVLIEPTIYITNRKCSVHTELLKYYCYEDAVCVCASCGLFGEHKGHHVELLNLASEKNKEKLRDVMVNLTSNKEEIKKRVQSLQVQMRKVQDKSHSIIEMVTVLFRDIREQLEVQEKRVLGEITRQSKQHLLKVSDLIQRLEIQKDELSRKMCLIEELCSMTDPINILQGGEYDQFIGIKGGYRDSNELSGLNELDDVLISLTLRKALTDIVADVLVKRGFYVHEASDMLLDVNTAEKYVALSDDLKTASYSRTNKLRPNQSDRFISCSQVLSTKTIYSGQHYWEVDVKASGVWGVGMTYPRIEKKGKQSLIGMNNKSWCLANQVNYYLAVHDSRETQLTTKSSCKRFGIYLDYEAGRLSFYQLCDPIRHLHTFTAIFTEPLHAVLCVYNSSAITIRS